MAEKKEARELPNNTGNAKTSVKGTKRKLIKRYLLVRKWSPSPKVLIWEGGLK